VLQLYRAALARIVLCIFSLSALPTFAQLTQPENASFEEPARATGEHLRPVDTGWAFTGNSGVLSQVVGSGSQHGKHLAFLKGDPAAASRGRVSRTVRFAAPGLYMLRFVSGGRGTVTVSVGGTVADTISMRNLVTFEMGSSWTQPFSISASGDYEVSFAQQSSVATDTGLIDNVIVVAVPAAFPNGSFEQANASKVPTGWTVSNATSELSGASGVAAAGLRELTMQAGGSASTTVSVPAAGAYSISFRSVGQSTCGATVDDITGGGQVSLAVLANSSSPSMTGFAPFTSSSFTLPAGARTLRISSQCLRRFDSFVLNRAGPTFTNANFESPTLPLPATSFDVPWLANPAGASWSFSGAEAGIQATGGAEASEPKADIGTQFGRVRAVGSSISQTVTLSPGTYLLAAQTAWGNLVVRANGALVTTGWGADSSRLTERIGTPFLVAQQGIYTFTFEPGSAGRFALDMPRILRIAEATPPTTSIALRVNGVAAPAQTSPGGELEAIATASDPDGLQRLRVLRNGVALAPENIATSPASAASPLTVTVSPLTAGNYTFTAEATDHLGSVGVASQSLLVNTPPTVNVVAPSANATVTSVPFTVTASASDPDGGQLLGKVQFFSTVNAVTSMLGEVVVNSPTATVSVNITNPKPGVHQIYARAFDEWGAQRDSTPIQVTVAGLLNGSFEIPGLASGTSCTGAGCTNNAWRFLNTEDAVASIVSGYSNNPAGTCRINATAGTHGAFVHGGAPAGRLRQEVYLIPGEYQLFLSAKRVGDLQHSIRAAVVGTAAGSAGTSFPLTTNYATYQVATTYTISTPGVYAVIIDSVANYTTDVACIEEVKLVALNKRPIFSAFTVSPQGTVHEPAPTIAISATASDPDTAGHVASIEFLVNGQEQTPALKCVNDTTPPARPFTCAQNWLNAPPGQTHVITARAIDDRGPALGTTTHTVTHTVVVNAGPTLNFVYPTQFLAVPGSPVTLKVTATDAENDAIQYVEFFHQQSGEVIGRVNSPTTGNEYHLAVTLMPGTQIVGARSIDVRGAAAPAVARQFTINPGNLAPTVLFYKNGDLNSEFGQTGVSFSAQSNDSDGQVAETWIDVNGTKPPCTSPVYPTTCAISLESNTPVGGYSVRGYARDNLGKIGASTNGFQVNVTPRRITCALTSARPNGVLVVNADNILNVSCKDLNGSSIGLYTIGWDAPANCSNSFVATDTEVATCIVRPTSTEPIVFSAYLADSNNDLVNGPLERSFTPIINQAPTISLVSPASETAISAPATFTIAVNPFDPEGGIKRVELLNVPSQGTVTPSLARTAPPWTFTWSNVPAGTYANIKARVYDEFDVSAEVAIPTLVSNALPSVTITAPANGAAYAVGAQAAFSANATDADGTVISVEYTATPANSAVVAQRFVSTAPGFPFTWSNLPNGDYVVTARATDNRGMQGAASAAVTIRVNSPPTVRFASPASNAFIAATPGLNSVLLSASDVSDADGVTSVSFQASLGHNTAAWTDAGSGSGTAPNYTATWFLVGPTTDTKYSMRACATDRRGLTGCSAPVNITIGAAPKMQCALRTTPAKSRYSINEIVSISASCHVNGAAVAAPQIVHESWARNNSNFPLGDTTCGSSGCSETLSSATIRELGSAISYSASVRHQSIAYASVPVSITIAVETNTISNGTFESPSTATFELGSAANGGGWTFAASAAGNSGIQRIGSRFSDNIAPLPLVGVNPYHEGYQTALVQSLGQTSTNLPNLATGNYELTFLLANRTNFGGQQRVRVRLTGVAGDALNTIYTAAPYQNTNTSFPRVTVPFTVSTAENYTLSFEGLNSGDNTALFDDVFIGRTGAATFTGPTGCTLSAPTSLGTNQQGSFTVSGCVGSGPFTYEWSRNGAAIGSNSTSIADTPFAAADASTVASATYNVVIRNSAGAMQLSREVTNSSYIGVPVAGNKLIFIHPDVKGSPLMATSAADNAGNVTVLWREDYSAFGVRRKNEGAANTGSAANSLWYIGKPQDNATGLVYFGARWYDPQVGRFMGFDPAGVDEDNPHSFNRYAYGNNNPYKYLDRDGRVAETVWDAASLTVGIASASQSYSQGKWGTLFVDIVGIVVDAAATAIPVVPGGAGMGIAAVRGVSASVKAERTTSAAERVLYHYTDEAGAKGIAETGKILPNSKGQVFLTDKKLSKDEVANTLFIGNSGTKGTHVVEVRMKDGVELKSIKNNELIHQGTIRDGRQADLKVGPNE
jgi:RHS repeat-associated protein